MSNLANRECIPCRGYTPPLKGAALQDLHAQIDENWQVINEHHLEKEYKFENFMQALDFTNRVGNLAESVNHHPDICLGWGYVQIVIWTHKINGLSESDFIFAAKVDELHRTDAS